MVSATPNRTRVFDRLPQGAPSLPKEIDARCYGDKTSISRFQRVLLLVSLVLRLEHCAVCHNINGRESNKGKRNKINTTAYFARNNNFEISLNFKMKSYKIDFFIVENRKVVSQKFSPSLKIPFYTVLDIFLFYLKMGHVYR